MNFKQYFNEENEKDNGFIIDIESETISNENYRKVLYTANNMQLVLMSLKPDEDIGEEVHDVDQFFRIDKGSGKVIINDVETDIKDGTAFIIPSGSKHNVIAGMDGLKLYTIYALAHHEDGIVQKTKEDSNNEF